MEITVTGQTIVAASGVVTAVLVLVGIFAKGVRWMDKQKKQDEDIEALRHTHNSDMDSVKQELALIIEGQLACLKGLQEQGCNGPVTAAVNKIEAHLNLKAHQ